MIDSKRYMAVIQFKSDATMQRIAMDAPKLTSLFDRFSRGEKEMAFRSKDGLLFGILFRSSVPGGVIGREFQQSDATQNGDSLCSSLRRGRLHPRCFSPGLLRGFSITKPTGRELRRTNVERAAN
jgi:hypothetical protein